MERISCSTNKIIDFLGTHPAIEKIYYPFDKSSNQKNIAEKQMKSGTGLFSVLLRTKDVSKIEHFCENLKYFQIAVSWGGYESLVFPVCAYIEREEAAELPINLVRFSVGLEDEDVCIEDF